MDNGENSFCPPFVRGRSHLHHEPTQIPRPNHAFAAKAGHRRKQYMHPTNTTGNVQIQSICIPS
jgi:hypothetical protein